MRGFRSTLILLAIFAALLGYLYFVPSKKPVGPDSTEPKSKVFTAQADKIDEVQVKQGAGDRTVLKRVDNTWSIVEPKALKADETEVTAIVTNLCSLELQRVVDDNPADIAQYGLGTPRVEIAFRKSGDKDLTRLQLGEKTTTGNDLYAKLPGEKRVFLVSSFLDATFNKSTFDLRDKTVLAFAREKVTALEVVAGKDAQAFAFENAQWRLTKPLAARADTAVVDGAVGRIQTVKMKSIVADEASEKDLIKYGLDKPSVTIAVTAGSARATLALGKAADAGSVYARDLSRPLIFTVESALATDFQKKADDYRPKDVFEFRPFTITRLEVARSGATIAFEKSKGKDGAEKWRQVSPAKDADPARMEALLSSLSSISVDKYVDAKTKTGLESPTMTVTARFDEGKKEEKVTFGRAGSDAFAARPGEPGAAQIAAARLDEALKALDALK